MANYCANSIVFYSKRKKPLEEIRQLVSRCLGDRKLNSVKQFLKFCGLPKVTNGEYCDGRDYFANCDANVEKDTAGYYLRVDTESAWNPNMTALEYMLKEKYNVTVKMVYQSEEPSSEIYINTDKLGIYFTVRYIVDYSYQGNGDTYYFTWWKEAVEFLNTTFPKAHLGYEEDLEKASKKITETYNFSEKDGDYFRFNKFEDGDRMMISIKNDNEQWR